MDERGSEEILARVPDAQNLALGYITKGESFDPILLISVFKVLTVFLPFQSCPGVGDDMRISSAQRHQLF